MRIAIVALVVLGLYVARRLGRPEELPEGIVASNGRIEATEIDVATKIAARVAEIFVDEGDFRRAGQLLARMDTASLEAQLKDAQAQLRQALVGVETARSHVVQRQAEKAAALAVIAQRQAQLDAESKRLARTEELAKSRVTSREELDDVRAQHEAARAAAIDAEPRVDAVRATIERIEVEIRDSELRSPRDGCVPYRVAQPGEVLAAGGRVLNLADPTDVYMIFFLPTRDAGRVAIGAEARLVLDAAPQYVMPASVTFVADVAQFTPKTVETAEERQKLTFRVKAHIPAELLRKHVTEVKTGLPGMAYVRLDPDVEWPERLRLRGPEERVVSSP